MRSRHYKSEEDLLVQLKQLKQEDDVLQPSRELQQKLIAAFRDQQQTAPTAKFWFKAAAVFVLSMLGGAIWILQPELRQQPRNENHPIAATESTDGYVPLTFGMTPGESLQRVRVRLPRSALNEFGITVKKTRSDEITADLLVGESGVPYAIRVVQLN
jgi:hypothetical protein